MLTRSILTRNLLLTTALALLLNFALATCALAEDEYPTRLVRIIVPFPAGGTADALARILADRLTLEWHQAVIVENRAGAGGNIGAEAVATAAPDGYVLLASPPGPLAINDILYNKLSFEPRKFEPIIVLGTVPSVLAVRPAFPARTVQDLIAHLKSRPETVTFASQGTGSTSHLSAMLFQKLTGTRMVHVPYRGSAPALQDMIGNHVDLFFDNLGSSLSLHNAGDLRILAVGSTERAASLPDVPTVAEAGVAGFQSVTWFAIAAPPGTPAWIALRINRAIDAALVAAEIKERFAQMGVHPLGGSMAQSARFIAEERARWSNVIRAAGIHIE